MFTFQCEFYFKGPASGAEALWNGELSSFLGALIRNGQIIEQHWYPLELKQRIRMYLGTPARDALSVRHFSRECSEAFRKLRPLLSRAPVYTYEGRSVDCPEDCRCRVPSHSILITNFLTELPPVRCGDCYRPTPLYRLPLPSGRGDYDPFRSWMALYKACDELQMASGFGERFGLYQMSNVKSPLSRMGRELCREMKDLSKRPFYYYLHGYQKPSGRPCPGCGRPWRLEENHHIFSHRCDRCALLSCTASGLLGWL